MVVAPCYDLRMGFRCFRSVFAVGSLVVVACGGATRSDVLADDIGFGQLTEDAGAAVTDGGSRADAGVLVDATTPIDAGGPVIVVDSGPVVVDSGVPDSGRDAGRDAGPPPRTFRCGQAGSLTCVSGQEDCCADFPNGSSRATYSCVNFGDCTTVDSVALECATSADCQQGDVCCGYLDNAQSSWNAVVCTSSCTNQNGLTAYVFCNTSGASGCPQGRTCRSSQVLSGYGYCQ